jgi:hypothetical protein
MLSKFQTAILSNLSALTLATIPAFAVPATGVSEQSPSAVANRLDANRLQLPSMNRVPADVAAFEFRARFVPDAVAKVLVPGEKFPSLALRADGTAETESVNFRYEMDETRSRFMLRRREGVPSPRVDPAKVVSEDSVVRRARRDLAALGISPSEIGSVEGRRLMVRTAPEASGSAPVDEVVGLKVFVSRTLGGIPVLGHRIVFSYDLDGSFRKVSGRWPTLAASGHRLASTLSQAQIADRVAGELINAESTDFEGTAPLTFVYDPETRSDGSVVLKLKVEASLDAQRAENVGERRVVLVDLPN